MELVQLYKKIKTCKTIDRQTRSLPEQSKFGIYLNSPVRELLAPVGTPVTSSIENFWVPSETTVDYDRMVSSIEWAIMDDHSKGFQILTPRELMFRSNPGIFAPLDEESHKSYSFVAKRSLHDNRKDTENSFSATNGLKFPKLVRTRSMQNMNISNNRNMFTRNHYHSNQDLSRIEKKDPSIAALHSNQPYVDSDELSKRLRQEDGKENSKSRHFPKIQIGGKKTNDDSMEKENAEEGFSLPKVRSELSVAFQTGCIAEVSRENSRYNTQKSKLEKWFSEMPGLEFEKVGKFLNDNKTPSRSPNKREQRSPDKKTVRAPNLKPLQSIPHQYLELRAEKGDRYINRGQYKLKQKSLHQLKLVDYAKKGKFKHKTETSFDTRQLTLINMDNPMSHDGKQTLDDLIRTRRENGESMNTINIGEFAVDAYYVHPNAKFEFAQLHEHLNEFPLDDTRSTQMTYKQGIMEPKPTFVNLEWRQSTATSSRRKNEEKSNLFSNLDERREDDSSGSSFKSDLQKSKSVLSKFNQLEVFSNGRKPRQMPPEVIENPLYKLDLNVVPANKEGPSSPDADRLLYGLPRLSFRFDKNEVVLERSQSSCLLAAADIPKPKLPRQEIPRSKQRSQASRNISRKAIKPRQMQLSKDDLHMLSARTNEFSENTYTLTPDYHNYPHKTKQELQNHQEELIAKLSPFEETRETDNPSAPPPSRQPTANPQPQVEEEKDKEDVKPEPLEKENTKDVATSVSSMGGTTSVKDSMIGELNIAAKAGDEDAFQGIEEVQENQEDVTSEEKINGSSLRDTEIKNEETTDVKEDDDINESKVQLSNFEGQVD